MSVTVEDLHDASFCTNLLEVQDINLSNKGFVDLGAVSEVANVTCLSLAFNSLTSLSPLSTLTQLHSLNVSHNQLAAVKGLSSLTHLTSLNAAHNSIKSAAALSPCTRLVDLFLQHNDLRSIEDFHILRSLPSLQRLSLHPNPITRQLAPATYRLAIVNLCTQLQVLDAKPVTPQERASSVVNPLEELSRSQKAAKGAGVGKQPAARNSKPSIPDGRQQEGVDAIKPARSSPTLAAGTKNRRARPAPGASAAGSGATTTTSTNGDAASAAPDVPDPEPLDFKDVISMLPTFKGPATSRKKAPVPAQNRKPPAPRPANARAVEFECRYPKGQRGVTVLSDGSATLCWPEGDIAASVEAEYNSAAISAAPDAGPTPPTYRMFASYRTSGIVAASWDADGGFVQHPNGAILFMYNASSGRGTVYTPGGTPTLRWHEGRGEAGPEPPSVVEAAMDSCLAMVFDPATKLLALYLACEGFRYKLVCGHNAPGETWTADEDTGPASKEMLKKLQDGPAKGKAGNSLPRPPSEPSLDE